MANVLTLFTPIFVFIIASSEGGYVIVEKGDLTNLQCTFLNTVTSVTWQLLNGNAAVKLSTCFSVNNTCTNQMPEFYQGHISSRGSSKVASLTVTSARKNETRFSCLTDTWSPSDETVLMVYAWPTKPRCSQRLTSTYIEYSCTTGNVYPGVAALIHRLGVNFSSSDIDSGNCSLGAAGSGTDGDFSGTCKWRIQWNKMFPQTIVYVEMEAYFSDIIQVNRSASFSDYITTNLSVPEVFVDQRNCPVGPGVRGKSIVLGTNATCKCEIKSRNMVFPEIARWVGKDNTAVGVEDQDDGSSTLTVSYDCSDPNQAYVCWPITPLKADVSNVEYKPKYKSSAPPSITVGLQPFVTILGAVSYGIVSRFT